jgi:O-antigen/teichoic acid export membrane protein
MHGCVGLRERHRRGGRPARRGGRGAGAAGLLAFGGRVSAFHVLNYAASNVDQLLIGWRFGPAPLGLYSRASQLVHLPLRQLNAPLTGVFVSALLKPVGHTMGWLLISQGRTRTLLHWGVFDAATRSLAVLLGLPGGSLGVAVALAVRRLLLPPVLVWLAGRSGPVSAADVVRACGLPALVGASAAAAVAASRAALPVTGAAGLGAAAACAALASGLVLGVSPAGRRALAELRLSLRLLAGGRPQPAAQ